MTMQDYDEALLPVSKLLLDPNNFRFQDEAQWVRADPMRFAEPNVQERAAKRLRNEGLLELKNSILSNGFLPVERLVVRRYETPSKGQSGPGDELYLVLEGNRRLAALKWIEDDHESGVEIPNGVVDVLNAVPVIVINSGGADTYLAIMGIRHVGGIKQWGGYQRAKLVAELRDDYGYDTTEVAERLGMTKHEVNRRYRALKSLQQMQVDEEYADYATSAMYPLFHEAVSLPAVRNWLGWDDSSLTFTDENKLRQFYDLIAPSRDEDAEGDSESSSSPKITTYSQVRELRAILANAEAAQILLDPDRSFSEAVAKAKAEELSKTWRTQVSEAITSLRSISAFDLEALSTEEVAVIESVREVSGKLLGTRQKLLSN